MIKMGPGGGVSRRANPGFYKELRFVWIRLRRKILRKQATRVVPAFFVSDGGF